MRISRAMGFLHLHDPECTIPMPMPWSSNTSINSFVCDYVSQSISTMPNQHALTPRLNLDCHGPWPASPECRSR